MANNLLFLDMVIYIFILLCPNLFAISSVRYSAEQPKHEKYHPYNESFRNVPTFSYIFP